MVGMEMGVGDRDVWVSLHPSEPDLGDPGQIHYGTRGLCRDFKQTQGNMGMFKPCCMSGLNPPLRLWRRRNGTENMRVLRRGGAVFAVGGKWMLDGIYQKNPSSATWVKSSTLAWGHSSPTSATGLSREERCPPQPMATCPCWNLAVCAEAWTMRVGGLTSGGNEVFWSQC